MSHRNKNEDQYAGLGDGSSISSSDLAILITGQDGSGNSQFITTDTDGHLQIDILSEVAQSTLVAFITDIPSAGTRVQLANNTVIAGVLQAPSTNTGSVYVGGSDVSSAVFGSELQPGQAIGVAIDNTNNIYVDTSSSGNDIAFLGS